MESLEGVIRISESMVTVKHEMQEGKSYARIQIESFTKEVLLVIEVFDCLGVSQGPLSGLSANQQKELQQAKVALWQKLKEGKG